MNAWGRAMSEYAAAMIASGKSPGTLRLYRYRILSLAERHAHPWKVTTRDLQEYMAVTTWKPETRKSVRAAFRSFYGWAYDAGHVDVDPAARLKAVRIPHAVPRPTPETVLSAALAVAEPRVVMMVRLAAFGGLRAAEIAGVHPDDVIGDALHVTGKGGKRRSVPLGNSDPELLAAIATCDGWVFPNGHGDHLTPAHVSRIVSRALPDGWTCHTLRHRFATTAYAGSRDLLAVGALLGHSRPETTQRYVAMPDDALRSAIRHTRRESPAERRSAAECRVDVVDAARGAGFIPADEAKDRFGLTFYELAELVDTGRVSMVSVTALGEIINGLPFATSLLRVADLEDAAARPGRPKLKVV